MATHGAFTKQSRGANGPALKGHAKIPIPPPSDLRCSKHRARSRVMRPDVRCGGWRKAPEKRACEPVEVGWDDALDLAAVATKKLIIEYGN